MGNDLMRDVVRQFVATVLNRGNVKVARDLLAPDFIDHHGFLGCPPALEGFEATLMALRNAFPDAYYRVDEFIVDGPKAVVQMTFQGTHLGPFKGLAATGRKVTLAGVHVFRLEGARLVEHWAYENVLPLIDLVPDTAPSAFDNTARSGQIKVIW
jgi:steroid delta-isomerase-like uncharacterized protein